MPSSKKTSLNELVQNHHLVQALWSAVNTSSGSLADVAPLVGRIIDTEAWRRREVVQLGEVVEFSRLADFIMTPPLRGCGWPLEKVEALIKDDLEVLAKWRRAITPAHGGDRKSESRIKNNNIILDRPVQGTSRSYTLNRLARDHEKLYERVVAGEIKANAAAIEAGFRKRMFAIPDDPGEAAKAIMRRWGPSGAAQLIASLHELMQ